MKKSLYIFLVLLIGMPYLIFLIHFYTGIFSNNNKDWADFGTFINGVLSPLIAISIGLLSYSLTKNQNIQRQENLEVDKRKHRPLISFDFIDSPDRISIKLVNKGLGPAQIIDYKILCDNKEYEGFFALLKDKSIDGLFTVYTNSITGFAISPNENINLFEIGKDEIIKNILLDEDEHTNESDIQTDDIIEYLDNLRLVFSKSVLIIEFKDVFDTVFPKISRDMLFYNRNIDS